MTKSINPTTGAEEISFSSKLTRLTNEPISQTPSGKNVYGATIQYVDPATAEVKNFDAIVNEGNYKYGMKVGENYLTRAIRQPGQSSVLIVVSHLTAAQRATASDFNFDGVEVASDATVEIAQA